MKCGFPFSREREKRFCILDALLSVLGWVIPPGFFQKHNQQDQAEKKGWKRKTGLPGKHNKKCLSSHVVYRIDIFFLSFVFFHICTTEYGKQTKKLNRFASVNSC